MTRKRFSIAGFNTLGSALSKAASASGIAKHRIVIFDILSFVFSLPPFPLVPIYTSASKLELRPVLLQKITVSTSEDPNRCLKVVRLFQFKLKVIFLKMFDKKKYISAFGS